MLFWYNAYRVIGGKREVGVRRRGGARRLSGDIITVTIEIPLGGATSSGSTWMDPSITPALSHCYAARSGLTP